ncbi:MAG: ankyrin-3-like [Rickettsiaceae bacterium]|jgi:ankyrin repeat protein|nr:ankyrin-3-like [Rickettsiaceae bacterium]
MHYIKYFVLIWNLTVYSIYAYIKSLPESEEAIKSFDIKSLRLHIKYKLNINKQDSERSTLLHIAIANDNFLAIKLLFEHGADPNIYSRYYETPLKQAIIKKNYALVKLLLENGANPNQKIINAYPIDIAIEKADMNIIELLLKYGAFPNIEQTIPTLHKAYDKHSNNTRKILNIFFKHGIDLNKLDQNGNSLLNLVINEEDLNLANFLLKHGANPNIEELFITPLNHAIKNKDMRLIHLLLKYNADPQLTDKDNGYTALHCAVLERSLKIIKLLLKHSKNPQELINTPSRKGDWPLHLAVESGDLHNVKVLIKNGALVDCVDNDGLSPLFIASAKGNLKIMDFLTKQGADIYRTIPGRDNILHNTISCFRRGLNGPQKLATVKLLIEKGFDLNENNRYDEPLLYILIRNQDYKIASLLLENGADIKLLNSYRPCNSKKQQAFFKVAESLLRERDLEITKENKDFILPALIGQLIKANNKDIESVKYICTAINQIKLLFPDKNILELIYFANKGSIIDVIEIIKMIDAGKHFSLSDFYEIMKYHLSNIKTIKCPDLTDYINKLKAAIKDLELYFYYPDNNEPEQISSLYQMLNREYFKKSNLINLAAKAILNAVIAGETTIEELIPLTKLTHQENSFLRILKQNNFILSQEQAIVKNNYIELEAKSPAFKVAFENQQELVALNNISISGQIEQFS